ncbi:MAG TPA: citramalate synthase [Clostridia bacterium]|nr:citramalate synthase [Clostridia bacterium]
MRQITIFDSTLRDGAQAEGISFSINDKINIVKAIDELGISIIEAGNPTANKKELEFFKEAKSLVLENSVLCAFGSTRRKSISVEKDKGCLMLLEAGTPYVSIVGKCSVFQVSKILHTTPEENLRMIEDTCRFFKEKNKKVVFDAEHFFDGYISDPSYVIESLKAAAKAGADCLCLCDTNGGTLPNKIFEITKEVCNAFPNINIGIHAHNDSDTAVASSLLAVQAGAQQVQGTFLGFGERCGNANLSSIIPNLQLKLGYSCIPDDNMSGLTSAALKISETANIILDKKAPFVGRSAFAHKAGMHVDAVLKTSSSFEHIEPSCVGNKRRFLMSEFTGKSAVLQKVLKLYPNFDKDSPLIKEILDEIKDKEYKGFQYEGADASLELIIKRKIDKFDPFFDLISYKVLDELPYDNNRSATATIKLKVNDTVKISASDGEGPVNALDSALREALSDFYPSLNKVRLVDYKVRVMEPKYATAAQVRVLITSTDGNEVWTTVGVSKDIIEASWIALVDSIEHKLKTRRK